MYLHDDDDEEHDHETTPVCRCKGELGELVVNKVGESGRFSWWNVDGVVGRDLLTHGCAASSAGVLSISLHDSRFYRRVFDRPIDDRFIGAGQFLNGPSEDLVVLVSPKWPMAAIANLVSSTTDSFGSKPSLRSPMANRLVVSADLYGKPGGSLYGDESSFSQTLSTKATMKRLEAQLKAQHLLPAGGKLGVPGVWPTYPLPH